MIPGSNRPNRVAPFDRNEPPPTPSGRRKRFALAALVVSLGLAAGATACSPIYVIKAGIAEAKILRARRPIPEVILDPATDETTRGKLTLVREARQFAMDDLGLDVGDSYTTFTRLKSDTLAMVLSAAYQDRLASHTWWFPIVGHVPYKGFFDLEDAQREQAKLEDQGYDTNLRPTSAFSTLGWFSDPLLSSIVRYNIVDLIDTVIHELSHNHLFLSGQVRFNESFANWVGRVGAVEFFCTREGGGPDTVLCQRARDRWHDDQVFSVFIDALVESLQKVYSDPNLSRAEKLERRQEIFDHERGRFVEEVQPQFRSRTFGGFLTTPLNNATLLARMRYYHRLPDFQAYLEVSGGKLGPAVNKMKEELTGLDDPFDVLTSGASPNS